MRKFSSLVIFSFFLLSACGTVDNNGSPTDGNNSSTHVLVTTYTIVFRNFATKEVLMITDKMENSSGFVRWRDPDRGFTVSRYGYVTRASGGNLYRYIYDILSEIGLSPDGRVKIIKRETTINLDKIF